MFNIRIFSKFLGFIVLSLVLWACRIPQEKYSHQATQGYQVKNQLVSPPARSEQDSGEVGESHSVVPPPQTALEQHLNEPRVLAFFNNTLWKKPAVEEYLRFMPPLNVTAYKGDIRLYEIPFTIKAVETDLLNGLLYWKVSWEEMGHEDDFEMYFPRADEATMGNQFHLNPKKDALGYLRPGTGVVYSSVSPKS